MAISSLFDHFLSPSLRQEIRLCCVNIVRFSPGRSPLFPFFSRGSVTLPSLQCVIIHFLLCALLHLVDRNFLVAFFRTMIALLVAAIPPLGPPFSSPPSMAPYPMRVEDLFLSSRRRMHEARKALSLFHFLTTGFFPITLIEMFLPNETRLGAPLFRLLAQAFDTFVEIEQSPCLSSKGLLYCHLPAAVLPFFHSDQLPHRFSKLFLRSPPLHPSPRAHKADFSFFFFSSI